MARNVVPLVVSEHRRLVELLGRARRGRGGRERHLEQLIAHVDAHVTAVAAELYDFAAARAANGEDGVRRLRAHDEHVRAALSRLASAQPPTAAAPEEELDDLETSLLGHARAEEELVRSAATTVEVTRLRQLGAAYERRRDASLKARPVRTGRTPRRLDVPRAALYEKARRAGIHGRSGMSRDQLIDALQRWEGRSQNGE